MDQSVGVVHSQQVDIPKDLELESGCILGPIRIAYETYGRLNEDRNNAILVCHALSGDAHAAGYHEGSQKPGWWDIAIGPGKGFDTNRYFVICSNIIGGCQGSTGPSSINPEDGRAYGTSFPVITIRDMVEAQKLLLDHLGIDKLYAVAGGSMGGMQALQWGVNHPEMVKRIIVIASTAYSTSQQIAFNAVGRRAITSDPDWKNGDYYGRAPPSLGLSVARMVGHITYLSEESMHNRFGRNLQDREKVGFDFSTDFQVESYLYHQGENFVKRFDANSYLYVTKAIDYFDLTVNGSLSTGLSSIKAKVMVVAITSDWLYPPHLSQEIVSALSANGAKVCYGEIRSNYGHDAFLLEKGQLNFLLKSFFNQVTSGDVMLSNVATIREDETIEMAADLMLQREVNHLPVVQNGGILRGIVTSWDIARAVACGFDELHQIISRPVFTTRAEEPLEEAIRRMELHRISALLVVDDASHVIGLLTNECIGPLFKRYK